MDKKRIMCANSAGSCSDVGHLITLGDFAVGNVRDYGQLQMGKRIISIEHFYIYPMNVTNVGTKILVFFLSITKTIINIILILAIFKFFVQIAIIKSTMGMER